MKRTIIYLFSVVLLILVACAPLNSTDILESKNIGMSVSFNSPTGLAIDTKGNLYVVDSGNHRVLKFDSEGNLSLEFGKHGKGEGEFNFHEDKGTICGISVDNQGNVFVVDKGNYRIQKFDSNGNFLMAWGSKGTGDGQFIRPIYIAIDYQGNVFVTDDRNPVIQKFDNNGQFLLKWGELGAKEGQFQHATGISIDSKGNVYVSDYENQNIQKFDNNGRYLATWETGITNGKSGVPEAIAIDGNDRIYITDSKLKQIEVFDSMGQSLATIKLQGTGLFNRISPYGIAIDSANNLYISDRNNERVLKYEIQPH